MSIEPFRECPRFQKCSVNNCPLHPQYMEMYTDIDDAEPKCTMEKEVRYRIGSKYPEILQYQGLTSREFKGKLRWETMDPEERQERIARAKSNLPSRAVNNDKVVAGVSMGEA